MAQVRIQHLPGLPKVQAGNRAIVSTIRVSNPSKKSSQTIYKFSLTVLGLPPGAVRDIVVRRFHDGQLMATGTAEALEVNCDLPFTILPGDAVTFQISALVEGEAGQTAMIKGGVFSVDTEEGYGEGGRLIPSPIDESGVKTEIILQ